MKDFEAENERLREMLRALKRDKFGKKSECFESPEQCLPFNEAEVLAGLPEADVEDEAGPETT